MARKILAIGTRYHRLTVVGEGTPRVRASGVVQRTTRFQCDCGTIKDIPASDVIRADRPIQGCGCVRKQSIAAIGRALFTTHGEAGKVRTAEFRAWESMRERCLCKSHHAYARYGGRGITICESWLASYQSFLRDMGRRPGSGYSLDRINNDGNYEPSNCRWATRMQQQNNTTSTRRVLFRGVMVTLRDVEEITGVSKKLLQRRLRSGWTLDKSVSQPRRSIKGTAIDSPHDPSYVSAACGASAEPQNPQ